MRTPLHHATVIGGPTGLSFTIGDSLLFAPFDDEQLYIVEPSHVIENAPVVADMAAYLCATVIEPRLLALVGQSIIA